MKLGNAHVISTEKQDKRSNGAAATWATRWLQGERTMESVGAISANEMLEMATLGFSMYEQGRYDNAKVIFSGLCVLDPHEAYYRTALGAVYMVQEDLDTAEKMFDAAISLNAKEIAPYVNRGEVHLRKGRLEKAASDFKSAVDLDPENKDPLSRRARVLASSALKMLEATHGDALKKSPTKPGAQGKGKASKK
jgi:Tfp pilus assembly protein PilF